MKRISEQNITDMWLNLFNKYHRSLREISLAADTHIYPEVNGQTRHILNSADE